MVSSEWLRTRAPHKPGTRMFSLTTSKRGLGIDSLDSNPESAEELAENSLAFDRQYEAEHGTLAPPASLHVCVDPMDAK